MNIILLRQVRIHCLFKGQGNVTNGNTGAKFDGFGGGVDVSFLFCVNY